MQYFPKPGPRARLLAASEELLALPAFYGRHNGVVVSPDSPPGVIAVSGQLAFVSLQVCGTQVIEAFALS